MCTKTESGDIEIDAQDAVATPTSAERKKVKKLFGEFDKLKDEATVELKIHIELEEETFVRSATMLN